MKRSLYHYVVFVVFLDLSVLIDRMLMACCSMSVLSPAPHRPLDRRDKLEMYTDIFLIEATRQTRSCLLLYLYPLETVNARASGRVLIRVTSIY